MILPESGLSKPSTSLLRVLLPAPLGPTRVVILPLFRVKEEKGETVRGRPVETGYFVTVSVRVRNRIPPDVVAQNVAPSARWSCILWVLAP